MSSHMLDNAISPIQNIEWLILNGDYKMLRVCHTDHKSEDTHQFLKLIV